MEQFKYPINDTRFETPSWTKAEHMESIAPLADLWGLDDNVQEQMKKKRFLERSVIFHPGDNGTAVTVRWDTVLWGMVREDK